jgi:Domain of unknown function (DUF4263)
VSISKSAQTVLQDIFAVGSEQTIGSKNRLRIPIPGYLELLKLCELLSTEPAEEELQKFLEKHPGFLTGITGNIDNTDLAVIFKPRIGPRYVADFCVLQAFQGGSVAHLVEIETSHEVIFTKSGKPSKRLADALKQVEDWKIYIEPHRVHFAKELVRMALSLPKLGDNFENGRGVRTKDASDLESHWQTFGGFDLPFFSYTVVIGRWSRLSADDKKRVIMRNRNQDTTVKLYTYEQVARLANFRLDRDEF